MYKVVFYETVNGYSQVWNFLEELRIAAADSKDARIQYKQARLYIQLLQDNGTRINENVTKPIGNGIWELRPGNNRIFYFCFCGDTIVLLHQFRKKTRKTPTQEIARANAERADYLARFGGDK